MNLSNQVLSDYMDWKVIFDELPDLDDRYLDAGTKLGIQMNAAKWRECKNIVLRIFGKLLERGKQKIFIKEQKKNL